MRPCPYALALDIALTRTCRRAVEVLATLRLLGYELDEAMRASAGLVKAGILSH